MFNRALCTGEKGKGKQTGKPLHFKGTKFHRVIKEFISLTMYAVVWCCLIRCRWSKEEILKGETVLVVSPSTVVNSKMRTSTWSTPLQVFITIKHEILQPYISCSRVSPQVCCLWQMLGQTPMAHSSLWPLLSHHGMLSVVITLAALWDPTIYVIK